MQSLILHYDQYDHFFKCLINSKGILAKWSRIPFLFGTGRCFPWTKRPNERSMRQLLCWQSLPDQIHGVSKDQNANLRQHPTNNNSIGTSNCMSFSIVFWIWCWFIGLLGPGKLDHAQLSTVFSQRTCPYNGHSACRARRNQHRTSASHVTKDTKVWPCWF